MKELDLTGFLQPQLPEGCNGAGLVFRYATSTWVGESGDLNVRSKFNLQRRKSCSCGGCLSLLDDLRERMAWNGSLKKTGIILPPVMDNNGLYRLIVTNKHTDWESGIVDDWDLEFVKL